MVAVRANNRSKKPSGRRRHTPNLRKSLLILFALPVPLLAVIWICEIRINHATRDKTYSDIAAIPETPVGLVLGTSHRVHSGSPNLFFYHRMAAASWLFRAGKIKAIVVSGDNRDPRYNEPRVMRRELVRLGIPEESIYFDFAGFRTLDSVVRIHRVFGQRRFTVISQKFQNQRAIFIAAHHRLDAIGFNAADVPGPIGMKTWIRERFARVQVFLDLFLGRKPRFLGEPVPIVFPPPEEEAAPDQSL